jgi:hypothetical protein
LPEEWKRELLTFRLRHLRLARQRWYDSDWYLSIGIAMPDPEATPRDKSPRTGPFQFSLGRLMVVVTLICVLLGLATLPRGFVDNVVISTIVLGLIPTILITCSIYARGEVQAFSIGALVPWLSILITRDAPARVWGLASWFFIGGLCGVVAVATRRWLEGRMGD